jgi:hypothetical protein
MPYFDPFLEALNEILLGYASTRLAAATAEQIVTAATHPPHACYNIIFVRFSMKKYNYSLIVLNCFRFQRD